MIDPRDELAAPGRVPSPSTAPAPQDPLQADPHLGTLADQSAPHDGARPDARADQAEPAVSEDQVKLVLRRVKDPELNLNVIDLGLIYSIAVEGSVVTVDMSLTSPGCPSGPEIMGDVERQVRSIPEVTDVQVNLVWSPYWTPERIEPRVRAYLDDASPRGAGAPGGLVGSSGCGRQFRVAPAPSLVTAGRAGRVPCFWYQLIM
jgi:metal-sulfur cluster biosynthetic enzyme